MELESDIGSSLGFFEVLDSDAMLKSSELSGLKVAGYSTSRDYQQLSLVEGCQIPKEFARVFKIKNCIKFDGQGMSGGALFKNMGSVNQPKWSVVGIIVAGMENDDGSWSNTFVSGSTILPNLK